MRKNKDFLAHILSNFVLAILILSVGFVCLYTGEKEIATQSDETIIYRNGYSQDCVSLTFNVYENAEVVERILDILDEFDAKATFFIGGIWAEKNESCLKKIIEKGHELGNHGYFHKDHSKLSRQGNKEEITACNKLVEAATGYKISLFAPPSGAYSKTTLSVALELGMKTVLWSRDTIDWRDSDVSVIYTRATKNVGGGDIVLMHPKEHTANALKDIINEYKRQSLRLITVSENLQIGG